MKVRKAIEKDLEDLLREKVENKKNGPILTGLIKALNEVWFYLDSQDTDKTPMSYTDLDKAFGYFNRDDVKSILLAAINNKSKSMLSRLEGKQKGRI